MHQNSTHSGIFLFVTTLVISALFGPKIGQAADLMVLVPAFAFLVMVSLGISLRINRSGLVALGLMCLIVAYTCIAALIQGVPDIQTLFRSIRALLSSAILGFTFYSLAANGFISIRNLLNSILLALLVLVSVVYLQLFFPTIQPVFADIWGFDKGVRQFRAFGLTAGYDTAGYLMAFSGMLSLGLFATYRSRRYLLASFICCAAVMFSSRSSMALLAILFLLTASRIGFARLGSIWRLWPIAAGLVAAFMLYVLPLYVATFDILTGVLSRARSVGFDPTTQFAETSFSLAYVSMWFVPEGLTHLLFGVGQDTPASDIGYVKILHMGGIALLLLIAVFILYLRSVCAAGLFTASSFQTTLERVESRLLYSVIFLFIVVLLLSNLKNLYFLTRSYHELFVILSFSALGFEDYFRSRVKYVVSSDDHAPMGTNEVTCS